MADNNKSSINVKKIVVYSVLFAIICYLLFFSPIRSLADFNLITNFVESFGMLAPIVFMIVYIIGLLIFFPASLLTVAGGFLFGVWFGTLYVVIAATIAAAIGFMISRNFSSKWNFETSNKLTQKIVSKCEGQCQEKGLQTFIILRLLYIPYMALSYAAGLVKTARFKDFITATFLTNIIGSFSFVFFGSQIDAGWKGLILPVCLIILTLLIPKVVNKFNKDK